MQGRKLLELLVERDGRNCSDCGSTNSGLVIHHRVYRWSAKEYTLDDFALLCIPCNIKKRNVGKPRLGFPGSRYHTYELCWKSGKKQLIMGHDICDAYERMGMPLDYVAQRVDGDIFNLKEVSTKLGGKIEELFIDTSLALQE